MTEENNNKLVDKVVEKVKQMNVDNSQEILELIHLLQSNEFIDRKKLGMYPINKICESLGIAVYGAAIDEDGVLYVDGTTKKIYDCNQVILTNNAYSKRKQREIKANLLGVYLLDYLKNFEGDHRKVYIATYGKTNMDNKAHYFAGELLTPSDIFTKEYVIAAEHNNHPLFKIFYLRDYFDVMPEFVEKRIHEICHGFPCSIECTDSRQYSKKQNNKFHN